MTTPFACIPAPRPPQYALLPGRCPRAAYGLSGEPGNSRPTIVRACAPLDRKDGKVLPFQTNAAATDEDAEYANLCAKAESTPNAAIFQACSASPSDVRAGPSRPSNPALAAHAWESSRVAAASG
jgi:hypothetical protein